ncbi:MAG: TIGR01212 family radical SAM protein [Paramuribaculum sp.]|nr:TIGR01212 family radical SAM protein [Paramuribaculum sp.]
MNRLPYRDFSDFLAGHFPGKMQKLTIDGGLTCPNRDGTLGRDGCIYCSNRSFTPSYCRSTMSVAEQIATGKRFFARKYPSMRYLAYFQSFTGTYADSSRLIALYTEALAAEGIDGLIIGTRPDCLNPSLLEWLSQLAQERFVMIEFGAETSHDATLQRINRCHTWQAVVEAVETTHRAGIATGLHIINGLPGENEEMIMQTVEAINRLPVDVVKFHQLQVVRGTPLARMWQEGTADLVCWTAQQYAELCADIVLRLRPDIAIDRFVSQSPDELLITPRWGLKNYEFTSLVIKALKRRQEN